MSKTIDANFSAMKNERERRTDIAERKKLRWLILDKGKMLVARDEKVKSEGESRHQMSSIIFYESWY